MSIPNDWMLDAAMRIWNQQNSFHGFTVEFARNKILECCPFKPDVVYMPVPRCDGCKHWDVKERTIEDTAECKLPSMSAIIDIQHALLEPNDTIHLEFQMRTKKDFGCILWEAK